MKASTKEKKRKREKEAKAESSPKGSDVEPPSKKTKPARTETQTNPTPAEEEPRTFATTKEWLESEQWTAIGISADEEDLQEFINSPNVDLWFIKAPLQFDDAAFLSRQFYVEDFTELKPGQATSLLTLRSDDKSYLLHAANPAEYRQLIDLFPSSEAQRPLLGKPFKLGFNITESVESQTASAVPIRARPIVPQPSNLRLRFRPPGYVMTKKELKAQEIMAKKHRKAVAMAKQMIPPLRPVPIPNKAGVITYASELPAGAEQDEMDEVEASQSVAGDEDEVPLQRKKKDKKDQAASPVDQKQKTTPSKKSHKKSKTPRKDNKGKNKTNAN